MAPRRRTPRFRDILPSDLRPLRQATAPRPHFVSRSVNIPASSAVPHQNSLQFARSLTYGMCVLFKPAETSNSSKSFGSHRVFLPWRMITAQISVTFPLFVRKTSFCVLMSAV